MKMDEADPSSLNQCKRLCSFEKTGLSSLYSRPGDLFSTPASSPLNSTEPHSYLLSNSNLPLPSVDQHKILQLLSTFDSLSAAGQSHFFQQLCLHCRRSQLQYIVNLIQPALRRDFIAQSPAEISFLILSFLDFKTIAAASRVSRPWRCLVVENPFLWKELYRRSCTSCDSLISSSSLSSWQWQELCRRNLTLQMSWMSGRSCSETVIPAHNEHVITCLQIDTEKIVTGSDDHSIKIWDLASGQEMGSLVGHTGGVWALSYVGDTLVSGSTDRTLRIWSLSARRTLFELIGHSSTIRCVSVAGNLIVSGSRDSTLRIWDISTGICQRVLVGHRASVRCLEVIGDSIVSGSYDHSLRLWSLSSGACLREFSGHTDKIYSLAFNETVLVSGSQDATVRVWQASTGDCIHILRGHRSLIGNVALARNSRNIISSSSDGTCRIWDSLTGTSIVRLTGQMSPITCLAFDDAKILTGSDRSLKLWDASSGAFVRDLVDDVDVVWKVAINSDTCVAACQADGSSILKIFKFQSS